MKNFLPFSFGRSVRLLGLGAVAVSMTSCIVEERPVGYYRPHPHYYAPQPPVAYAPPPPVYAAPGPVMVEPGAYYEVLPPGARMVWVHGQRCWVHRGVYYRPHPRGYGYITFRF